MLITLDIWAERLNPPPTTNTLRAWARSGKFSPPAQKMGRTYYVDGEMAWPRIN